MISSPLQSLPMRRLVRGVAEGITKFASKRPGPMNNKSAQCISSQENNQQLVKDTIDSIVGDKVLPGILACMLKEAWTEYMLHTLDVNGENSDEWGSSVAVVKLLLWSVGLDKNVTQRASLLYKIPELIAGLKKGLESVNYGPYKTSILLEQLREIHLGMLGVDNGRINNSEKQLPADSVSDELTSEPVNSGLYSHARHIEKINPVFNIKVDARHDTGKSFDTPNGTIKYKMYLNNQQNQSYSRIKMLQIGTWAEFRSEGGPFQCRLSEKVGDNETMLFVNRHGAKVSEKSFLEFENALDNGDVKILDDAFLFDRALASVIGNSRNHKKH